MNPKVKNNKTAIAEEYHSPILDEFLALEDPAETARTETRMMLAALIADTMQEKNIAKKELAQRLNQHQSVVTKWLSGKHNFTSDTLTDIGRVLGISLFAHSEQPKQEVVEYKVSFVIEMPKVRPNPLPIPKAYNNFLYTEKPFAYS